MITSVPKMMLFALVLILAVAWKEVSAATLRGGSEGVVTEETNPERELINCVDHGDDDVFYLKIEGRWLKMDQGGTSDYNVISRGNKGNSPTRWEIKNGGLFNVGKSRYARVLGDNVKGRQDRSGWTVTFQEQSNCNLVKIKLKRNNDEYWLKHTSGHNVKAVTSESDGEVFELKD